MTKLQELYEQLQALENDIYMDHLEKMRLQFKIQDLIAEEEMKKFLDEQEA